MAQRDRLLALVDEVYAASLDDRSWERVMEQIVAAVGGVGGALAIQDMQSHRLDSATWVGDAAVRLASSYEGHVAAQNVLWQRTATAPVGSVFTDNMVLPGNGVRRFDYYHEVMRPLGIGNAMAAIVLREGTLSGTATVLRAFDRPDFGAEEVELLRGLGPHLARALQIRRRLAVADRERAVSRAAMEQLACAVLIVDRSGRATIANHAAERLVQRGDGLRLVLGALDCEDARETRELREALSRSAEGEGSGASMAISRRSGRRPLSVVVAPLPVGGGWLADDAPAALLVVTDPDEPSGAAPDLLSALYGLTPAEARTAVALAEAERPAEIADRLGVSVATVRTHMQRAFAKTGTSRQSELVRLVLAHGRART